jgi:hypothetical protein
MDNPAEDECEGYSCPMCDTHNGSFLGGSKRSSFEPQISEADGYRSFNLSVIREMEGRCNSATYDIVFLNGEPDKSYTGHPLNPDGTVTVEGVTYRYQRAWLFSCQLCGAEIPLPFGYWEAQT